MLSKCIERELSGQMGIFSVASFFGRLHTSIPGYAGPERSTWNVLYSAQPHHTTEESKTSEQKRLEEEEMGIFTRFFARAGSWGGTVSNGRKNLRSAANISDF